MDRSWAADHRVGNSGSRDTLWALPPAWPSRVGSILLRLFWLATVFCLLGYLQHLKVAGEEELARQAVARREAQSRRLQLLGDWASADDPGFTFSFAPDGYFRIETDHALGDKGTYEMLEDGEVRLRLELAGSLFVIGDRRSRTVRVKCRVENDILMISYPSGLTSCLTDGNVTIPPGRGEGITCRRKPVEDGGKWPRRQVPVYD